MTMGTIQAVLDMGFRCPDDVSIAGIDDFPWSAASPPDHGRPADRRRGGAAVALLLERLAPGTAPSAEAAPRLAVLPPRLLMRDSCQRIETHQTRAGEGGLT